jgi:hypothetical protein
MRAAVVLALGLLACGDNTRVTPKDDAAIPDAPAALKACLEQPNALPRPPSGQLPCELLPPGFGE